MNARTRSDLRITTKLTTGPGSWLDLTSRQRGVLSVTTPGDTHFVRGHVPVSVDVTIHFLPDAVTAIARANLTYRYGNPGNDQLTGSERTEVLRTILDAVHSWRMSNDMSSCVGRLEETSNPEAEISSAEDQLARLQVQLSEASAARRAAVAREEEITSYVAATSQHLSALRKQVRPDYLLTTADPVEEGPWFVFDHANGRYRIVVEADDFTTARHVLQLEAQARSADSFGSYLRAMQLVSGDRPDGSYSLRPDRLSSVSGSPEDARTRWYDRESALLVIR